MANEGHVDLLKQGVSAWNQGCQDLDISPDLRGADLCGLDLRRAHLRRTHLSGSNLIMADLSEAHLIGADLIQADLSGANLRRADLSGADLRRANLAGADLSEARLSGANLRGARLSGANLRRAHLTEADLTEADLSGAHLSGAHLSGAHLSGSNLSKANLRRADLTKAYLIRANLSKADLAEASLGYTAFGNTNLTGALGLDACRHLARSIIDHQTMEKSDSLPLTFLRGVGLPDLLIDYLPSLLSRPIQLYSCFISYSARDQEFADRLYADLQNKGVRCWFAPHDMPIGAKIWDALDEAIRLRDRVLLILSEGSIASDWVEDEVSKAFAEERDRNHTILLPIRLDNLVLKTSEPWAQKLKDQRNIGDFTNWKDHDSYQKSFERVLRDLKIKEMPSI